MARNCPWGPQGKADNQILAWYRPCVSQHPGREVVLVSKDINMRIKARAMGLPAEDYFSTTRPWKTATRCTPASAAAIRFLGALCQGYGKAGPKVA